METTNFQLNPFFRVRFGEKPVCDLFLDRRTYELPSVQYLRLFAAIKKPLPFTALVIIVCKTFDLDRDEATNVAHDLIEAKILVDSQTDYPELPAVKHWLKRGWLDALMLHLKSRNLEFADEKTSLPEELKRKMFSDILAREGMPQFWKTYKDVPTSSLPVPTELPQVRSFQEVLLSRRSNQPWCSNTVKLQDLANILYYANIEAVRERKAAEAAVKEGRLEGLLWHSAFSALESYVMVFSVENTEPGIYHYDLQNHRLALINLGMHRKSIVKMCIGQAQPYRSACAFVISAVWERYMYRYRHPRAYRNLLVNTAELAQKYLLLATTYRYSQFLTPALNDKFADHLFNVNGYQEAPLYVIAVG